MLGQRPVGPGVETTSVGPDVETASVGTWC